MALITCPSCGQEISDKAKQCVHCGAEVNLDNKPSKMCVECGKTFDAEMQVCPFCGCPAEKVEVVAAHTDNKKRNKKVPTIAAVVITLLVVLVAVFSSGPALNNYEQLVYEDAKTLKEMMRNPDSFVLYEDSFVREILDDSNNVKYVYTFINYGGTNSYGALTRGQAIFKDGNYIVDYAEYDADKKQYMELLVDLAGCDLGSTPFRDTLVDIEIIKDKMGLK